MIVLLFINRIGLNQSGKSKMPEKKKKSKMPVQTRLSINIVQDLASYFN